MLFEVFEIDAVFNQQINWIFVVFLSVNVKVKVELPSRNWLGHAAICVRQSDAKLNNFQDVNIRFDPCVFSVLAWPWRIIRLHNCTWKLSVLFKIVIKPCLPLLHTGTCRAGLKFFQVLPRSCKPRHSWYLAQAGCLYPNFAARHEKTFNFNLLPVAAILAVC